MKLFTQRIEKIITVYSIMFKQAKRTVRVNVTVFEYDLV